ncbi:molecular chaperone [Pseudoxanthomonas sp. NC8]|nr:molecular chaperone [Pseudoxanthomonas sp. NC8]
MPVPTRSRPRSGEPLDLGRRQDQLAPTRDLVASPAILEVAAGERQLVRLIRPRAEPSASEAAYRLVIDELPADASAPRDPGLRFLLRYSVPVFVLADGDQPLSPSRRTAATPAPGRRPGRAVRPPGHAGCGQHAEHYQQRAPAGQAERSCLDRRQRQADRHRPRAAGVRACRSADAMDDPPAATAARQRRRPEGEVQ